MHGGILRESKMEKNVSEEEAAGDVEAESTNCKKESEMSLPMELGPIEQDVQMIKELQSTQVRTIQEELQLIKETRNAAMSIVSEDPAAEETVSLSDGVVVLQNDIDMSEIVGPVYTIADNGTKRGGRLLLDSRGFSFTVKLQGKNTTTWKCSVRNKVNRCPASIKQTLEGFKEGKQSHNHEPKPKSITKVNIITEIKERSRLMMNDTARKVVRDVVSKYYNAGIVAGGLPSTPVLIRLANRARATLRPNNPKNLNFKINDHYMPQDFIKADIQCDSDRHILMASNDQLSILADTKIWLVDCTNKFVQHPFTHVLSIQTYVRLELEVILIPLAFVLMSKHRQRDYKAVLEHLVKLLPHRQSVKKAVLDFDVPLWKAFQSAMPNVLIQGCAFHWMKNIKKKMPRTKLEAEISLSRKIMALVYLPSEEIPDALIRLQKKNKKCQSLFSHVESNWVKHTFWRPHHWSVFEQVVRTETDVEEWHRKIEKHIDGKTTGLYELVGQFDSISKLDLPAHWKLVSEEKLCSLKKKQWQHAKLFRLWKKYLKHRISIEDLLESCTILDFPI
ncbi:uncharacterized protein [Antedon mediterranea]|uniref:uncharacterized protein n=1 Tax=Antedon mediterranea TaxID=105859 RepID=UPI003AF717B6